MRIRNLILNLAIFMTVVGCTPEETPIPESNMEFTIRPTEVTYNYAKLNITHNGPEDLTWYGFLTTDTQGSALNTFIDKYGELIMSGEEITGIMGTNDRYVLLENLEEDTKYRYIVFGIGKNGELNDEIPMNYLDFTTPLNAYQLTKTEEWDFNYSRDTETGEEIIDVTAHRKGLFGLSYISKEQIEAFEKEYPDGYELWEGDVYVGKFNAVEMFLLEQISMIQYQVQMGVNIENVTFVDNGTEPEFKMPRLASGEYTLLAFGFTKDGQHTRTYSAKEITINKEEPTPEYTSWLGTYKFSGMVEKTDDYDQVQEEPKDYYIRIEEVDPNHMYRIRGWECRPPEGYDWENIVEKDWEEDILGFDKDGEDLIGFPAYFKDGKLEIRESPITNITFGDGTIHTLGIIGYALYEEQKQVIPVILQDTPMAIAEPIAEGENSTVLTGLDATYEAGNQKIELTYLKMGYVAYESTAMSSYVTLNPAMKFPITITRIDDTPSDELE